MISAVVSGVVGRDAEVRQAGGDQVLTFSVASRRYVSKGEDDATDWVAVSVWGRRAEALRPHVTKGSRVAVRGAMHVREYEHNGATRWSIELRADDVELLGAGKNGGGDGF